MSTNIKHTDAGNVPIAQELSDALHAKIVRGILTLDEGVCHFSLQILVMSTRSESILDHIADYL
jgi:hypothetical protein